MPGEIDMMPKVNEIMASNLPEIERLAQAFNYLLEQYAAITRREGELQKALGDKEALLKLQIQTNTYEYIQGMFKDCYRLTKERGVSNGASRNRD